MKTIAKIIIGTIIAMCAFVALGEMEESTFTEILVAKSVAGVLLLVGVKCYNALDEE